MRKLFHSPAGLFALFAGFLLLTALTTFGLKGFRFDLTENKLYTLSDGTLNTLKAIPDPITLSLYFSDKASADLPALRSYAARVREILEEYASASAGKLTLTVIDPAPFSEEEDEATASGLQGVPGGMRGDDLFFGLVGRAGEREEVIPFFQMDKEQFLEYDLTKMVNTLASAKQRVIGVVSPLNVNGGFDYMQQQRTPAWVIVQQMEDFFDVRWVADDIDEIDADIDVLVVIHPKLISPALQLAIDQFTLRGGRALIFVDPYAEADVPPSPMMGTGDRRSDLPPLLARWGLTLRDNAVVGDYANSLVVNMGQGRAPMRHLGLFGATPSAFQADDVLTQGLESVNFATAGILDIAPVAGITVEPMVQSSEQSMPLAADQFSTMNSPAQLLNNFKPTGERYVIAARVSGKATTAFPEGVEVPEESANNADEADKKTPPVMRKVMPKLTEGEVQVMVVADSDVLTDRLWVQVQDFFGQQVASAWADNGTFLVNSLEHYAGSADLISIRSRGRFSRPFTRVEALRRDAEEQLLVQQQALESKLKETETKLAELEGLRQQGDQALFTEEQAETLKNFQKEKLGIRKELREVQHQLDRAIENLGTQLKLINILLVPVGLTLLVLGFRLFRRRKA